ncbi:hypothetical protein QYF36_019017 [Acer negundo]|nr:hypothetical protein QYF36_019017 [Acer negundo]
MVNWREDPWRYLSLSGFSCTPPLASFMLSWLGAWSTRYPDIGCSCSGGTLLILVAGYLSGAIEGYFTELCDRILSRTPHRATLGLLGLLGLLA